MTEQRGSDEMQTVIVAAMGGVGEAVRRGRLRVARDIYRRGEGVRVSQICIIREGLTRRLRERGDELTRAGKAGGWGDEVERGPLVSGGGVSE